MLAVYFLLATILLSGIFLSQQSMAILPDTMLQQEKEFGECDITEMDYGLFRPARITIEYHPEIKLEKEAIGRNDDVGSKVDRSVIEGIFDPNSQLFQNTLYNLGTNRTEHFVFKWQFRTNASPDNPKIINFRYISQDNIQVVMESPKITSETYCKVLSVKIGEPPFVQTKEELFSELALYHGDRFAQLSLTDQQQTDLLLILVLALVGGFSVFGLGIFLIFFFSRRNVEKFDTATKNLRMVIGKQKNVIESNQLAVENIKEIMNLIRISIQSQIERSVNDFMMFLSSETGKVIKKKDIEKPIEPKKDDGILESKVLPMVKTFGKQVIGQFIDVKEKVELDQNEQYRRTFSANSEEVNRELNKSLFEQYKKSLEGNKEDKELYNQLMVLDSVLRKQIIDRKVDDNAQ